MHHSWSLFRRTYCCADCCGNQPMWAPHLRRSAIFLMWRWETIFNLQLCWPLNSLSPFPSKRWDGFPSLLLRKPVRMELLPGKIQRKCSRKTDRVCQEIPDKPSGEKSESALLAKICACRICRDEQLRPAVWGSVLHQLFQRRTVSCRNSEKDFLWDNISESKIRRGQRNFDVCSIWRGFGRGCAADSVFCCQVWLWTRDSYRKETRFPKSTASIIFLKNPSILSIDREEFIAWPPNK